MALLKETLERILQISLEGIFTVTTPSGHGRSEMRNTPYGIIKYRLEPFDRVIDGTWQSDEHAEYFNLLGAHGMMEVTYSEKLGWGEIAFNHIGMATQIPGLGQRLQRSILTSPQFRVFLTSLDQIQTRGPRSDLEIPNSEALDSLIRSVKSIASFQYSQPKETEELETYGLPEEVALALMQAVDREIRGVDRFSQSTMTGIMGGGGVGRFQFKHEGKSYWFKIDREDVPAFKSSVIPSLIYDWARRGNPLAKSLARLTPRPLNFLPVIKNGYYVTFSEDVTSRVVNYTPQDFAILKPEFDRNELEPALISRIYTTALYHEIMTEIAGDFTDELIRMEVFPTNLSREMLIDRLGSRFTEVRSLFERSAARGYEENVHRLLEHEARRTTLGIYDNKPENYVGSCFVDFGISKQGDEIDDLSRLVLGRTDVIKNPQLFDQYLDAYVRIRQMIQQQYRGEVTYSTTPGLKQLVRKQLEFDTWRNMGWALKAHHSEEEFNRLYLCAEALANQ